jgi:uncharacterized protein
MQKQTIQFEVKSLLDTGWFSGYGSIFGNEDRQGDVVVKGAFLNTLGSGNQIPILLNHDPDQILGVYVKMTEDENGLYLEGQLNMDVARAREVYSLMKQGAIRGLSIGYITKTAAKDRNGRRHLKEVELMEVSLTPMPANPLAQVVAVKEVALEEKEEAVVVDTTELDTLKSQVESLSAQLSEARSTIGLYELLSEIRN